MHQLIRDFYVKRSENFDFLIYGPSTRNISDLVNDLARRINFPVKIIHHTSTHTNNAISQSAVLFFKSTEIYNASLSKISFVNQSPKEFHFLVYIEDLNSESQSKIRPIGGFRSFREVFLIQKNGEKDPIQLFTFVTFKKSSCSKVMKVFINSFLNSTKKWRNKQFSAKSQKNFNGCNLAIKIGNCYKSELSIESNEIRGYFSILNDIIAQKLNYKYQFYTESKSKKIDFEIATGCITTPQNSDNYKTKISTFPFTSNDDIIFYTSHHLHASGETVANLGNVLFFISKITLFFMVLIAFLNILAFKCKRVRHVM